MPSSLMGCVFVCLDDTASAELIFLCCWDYYVDCLFCCMNPVELVTVSLMKIDGEAHCFKKTQKNQPHLQPLRSSPHLKPQLFAADLSNSELVTDEKSLNHKLQL